MLRLLRWATVVNNSIDEWLVIHVELGGRRLLKANLTKKVAQSKDTLKMEVTTYSSLRK